jgi:hypothetical protein
MTENTTKAEIDARYKAEGWEKVQLGGTVLYEKPLPEEVIAEIKRIDQERKAKPLWRRIFDKVILLNL